MPSKMTKKAAAAAAALQSIPNELLDQIITGPITAEAVNAESMAFKKAFIERPLGAGLGHHLGYLSGASKPLLILKHERRFTGFDEKIVAMCARGMTVREVQGFLAEQYSVEVGSKFISSVTDTVMAEVTAWQTRPFEPMYRVVFFDALQLKTCDDAVVRNKAIYLALGVLPDGSRDILGLWIENTEDAKFWMKVLNDRKAHDVNDILVAVTDGLKGMPEAPGAVFPAATLVTCIVHLIRNSLDYASWTDRSALAAAIRPIYCRISSDWTHLISSEWDHPISG